MKILLVDDDLFALKLLARQLADLGCSDVVTCEHAQDALTMLHESGPGDIPLVFCDLQMPDVDGVEFVRHLAGMSYPGALVLLSGEDERILRTVHRLAQAHHVHVLGAVSKPVTSEQLRQLLAEFAVHPDAALEAAASAVCTPDELRRAIRDGHLALHYQPKVDLGTGALIGVEALVRWQHPHAGMIFPDQFIGMAEDHALIDELTSQVLRQALSQARSWKDAGLDLQLSVNVSMSNLVVLDFPDQVAQMAHEAGIALPRLMLEVTESRLMQDIRAPLDILMRLRLKRIGLSIDDFGTGHSSLAQLRDVPFDELKLDRSFVDGAATDARLGAIVEGALAMARHLDIKTVAEGVEDRAAWNYLRASGCDEAQGYFIARPMPGVEMCDWQKRWEQRRAGLVAPGA